MNIKRYALAIILAVAPSLSQASLVIDSFSTPQSVKVTSATTANSSTAATMFGDILGGTRTINLNWGTGGTEASVNVAADVANVLDFNQNSRVQSYATIIWDGLAGADLTAGGNNGFALDVIDLDGAIGLTITVTSGANSSAYTMNLASVADIKTQNISFADFTATGADNDANFASVTSITMKLNGTLVSSADVSLDNFVATKINTVPEPSSIAVLALSLIGVAAIRRRVK